ncbi:MAG: transposase [Marinoscillum sp.]|jgi:transposase
MTVEERRRRRFSEEFRKEQVQLVEQGQLTIADICRLYHVKRDSVMRWFTKYGKKKLPGKILVTNGKEVDRIRELEKENRKLMEFIGKQQVELVYKNELIKVAKEKLREDLEKK